jgi:uncharacterized protein YuzE
MGFNIAYDKETDTLNITLTKGAVSESEYIEDKGVVLDYDNSDRVVAIEILGYSKKFTDGFEVDVPVEAVRVA